MINATKTSAYRLFAPSIEWRNLVSTPADQSKRCRIILKTELQSLVRFCWLDLSGDLVPQNGAWINSFVGHAFVAFHASDDTESIPIHLTDIPEDKLIFHFTPTTADTLYIITIAPLQLPNLRGTFPVVRVNVEEVIDTAFSKVYTSVTIEGFTVKYEPNLFRDVTNLQDALRQDLAVISQLLPTSALEKLQSTVPIYANKSITYGPKSKPTTGETCHFHPNETFLWENGLAGEKQGCIEIQSAASYLNNRQFWGPGGLLLHELCHAFQFHFCPGGFNCEEIENAFNSAVSRGLYRSVSVHTSNGLGQARAYALTNSKEFFAELSVAYHWNNPTLKLEYNKSYPFNREELQEYDAETFQVLHRLWNQ